MVDIANFFSENAFIVAIINILSFVSFVISIFVLCGVSKIKNSYLFKARVPEHLNKLKKYSSNLTDIYQKFDPINNNGDLNLEYIKNEFNTIKGKVDRNFDKKNLTNVVKKINEYKSDENKTNSKLWSLYVDIKGLIQLIENYKSDKDWEK